jgi:hypothetical protein
MINKMTPMNDEELQALASDFAARLKAVAPDWTDRPEHDPAVTLLEVFAFLTEQLAFRSNQIPERGRRVITTMVTTLETLCSRSRQPIDGLTRVNFFSGQLLTADDFQAEQDYFRAKHRRHNRMLLGVGIVTGLEVSVEPSSSDERPVVSVGAGSAIAPDGEELFLPAPRLCPFCATISSGFITLQYVERVSDPIAPTGEDVYQASRIREGVVIGFAESLPENAVGLAKLERKNRTWHIAEDFRAPRVPVVAARS